MSIIVGPLSRVPDLIVRHRPGRVVSILDPGVPFPELGPDYAGRHLRLSFHDAFWEAPGVSIATTEDVAQLLAFLDNWGARESLLVHCRAGIGRSTAAAFIAACYRNPSISELAIAVDLRRIAPLSRPNEALIAVADEMMDRGGRMSAAIAETGRGLAWVDVSEGEPFEWFERGARSGGGKQ